VKCISLWQPWATLIAIGAKRVETRSWPTNYRGPILIHASKKWDAELIGIRSDGRFDEPLREAGLEELPLGCIVAVSSIVKIERTEAVRDRLSAQERAFGNYETGRWAWALGRPVRITPIPFKGAQGIFDVPDNVLEMPPAVEEAAPRTFEPPKPKPEPTLFDGPSGRWA